MDRAIAAGASTAGSADRPPQVKGKPKRINAGVRSIVDTPIEAHSKKPDCVKDRIINLCGDLPRIELFARQKTLGWDVWGNEVNSIGEDND